MKCPGVTDLLRVPKLGAAFYMAQVDPSVRAVIEPDFYWDFGPKTPARPGERSTIFSNCDRLEIFLDGKSQATVDPDRAGFPGIPYPPFFVDLTLPGLPIPELLIDGYVRGTCVLSRSFSADRASDRLGVQVDDQQLQADGADATRLVFRATDRFGAPRPYAGGKVSLVLDGPGIIIGDNPSTWRPTGAWVRYGSRRFPAAPAQSTKQQRATHAAIVENKRPAHALAIVKAQQDLKRETKLLTNREKPATKRPRRSICLLRR